MHACSLQCLGALLGTRPIGVGKANHLPTKQLGERRHVIANLRPALLLGATREVHVRSRMRGNLEALVDLTYLVLGDTEVRHIWQEVSSCWVEACCRRQSSRQSTS